MSDYTHKDAERALWLLRRLISGECDWDIGHMNAQIDDLAAYIERLETKRDKWKAMAQQLAEWCGDLQMWGDGSPHEKALRYIRFAKEAVRRAD